jgi:cytochrome c peroxidase
MKALFFGLSISIFLISCGNSENQADKKLEAEHARYDLALQEKLDLFGTLNQIADNPVNPVTEDKVNLGKHLYFDSRLSLDGKNSCNSCHNLSSYGVDNLQFSPGDKGMVGDRNSPTVLNAAFHFAQFWDGRAKDVEEQAGMPILNPIEMAIPNEKFLIDRLSKIELYQSLFQKAFPEDKEPLNYNNLKKSIAAFERKLVTPSRFDKYLTGDSKALTIEEKKGFLSFVNSGCTSLYDDYWNHTKSAHVDEGKFKLTKEEQDKYVFKVPSLRNVEMTYPYFHDGSVKDLEEAVRIMAKTQVKDALSESEIKNITAFLKSLTGEIPEEYKKAPATL